MIRINLLEVREERRKLAIRNLIVVSATTWVTTLLVLVLWHQGLLGDIAAADARVKKEKTEIDRLNEIVGEVEQIKGKKTDLEQKLGVIKSLEANRAEIVDLMLALAEVLHEEVWVDSLTVTGREISIEAMAVDMQAIGVLVKALKSDPRFANPRTSGIQLSGAKLGKTDGKAGAVKFKLSVQFNPPQAAKAS